MAHNSEQWSAELVGRLRQIERTDPPDLAAERVRLGAGAAERIDKIHRYLANQVPAEKYGLFLGLPFRLDIVG